ncbi:MAG: orotidine-5'-phosphate decarboxylase [Alphaproteobacteria bacterium]
MFEKPIFVALDTADPERAAGWVEAVRPHVGGVKLGLEFVCANGPEGVRRIVALGLPVFLDLKYHDIPNTVAGAVRATAGLGVAMLSVHAAGGPRMMRAAVAAAREAEGNARPLVLGVTVLTSLDDTDLLGIGQYGPAAVQAERLAGLAMDCGLDGVVCSHVEIQPLRELCGPVCKLIVPGIRPRPEEAGDQKRFTTPRRALELGADVLIIGRPITRAGEPARAAAQIAAELA